MFINKISSQLKWTCIGTLCSLIMQLKKPMSRCSFQMSNIWIEVLITQHLSFVKKSDFQTPSFLFMSFIQCASKSNLISTKKMFLKRDIFIESFFPSFPDVHFNDSTKNLWRRPIQLKTFIWNNYIIEKNVKYKNTFTLLQTNISYTKLL